MNHDFVVLIGDAAYALIVLAASLAMMACALESIKTQICEVAFSIWMRTHLYKDDELEGGDDDANP